MPSKNQLLLHIYQLGFEKVKEQIPVLDEVLLSHSDWLVLHRCGKEQQNINCKFDEWFSNLQLSPLQQNSHFRLLGHFKNELHHATTQTPPFEDFF